MTIRLSSYRPLCINEHGRRAVEQYGIPPFVDSSFRRDPDLENPAPSITALCRGENFAPQLQLGDIVVYLTRTGDYGYFSTGNRVLTAVLEVAEIYNNHEEAALWYRQHDLPIPSDCMVTGNPPYSWDQTAGVNSRDFDNIADWDAFYLARSIRIPVFIRTRKIFCDIHHPPVITNDMLIDIFGRIPRTQTPPAISEEQLERLMDVSGVELVDTCF